MVAFCSGASSPLHAAADGGLAAKLLEVVSASRSEAACGARPAPL